VTSELRAPENLSVLLDLKPVTRLVSLTCRVNSLLILVNKHAGEFFEGEAGQSGSPENIYILQISSE
jgi:hypothetical protein